MAQRGHSEEEAAAYGAVAAVSVATGGMITMMELVNGSLSIVAVPTVALVVALVARPVHAAWAAMGIWVAILPLANGLAVLAPLMMVVICLALAVGPGRLLDWVRDDWMGGGRPPPPPSATISWIEDDADRARG